MYLKNKRLKEEMPFINKTYDDQSLGAGKDLDLYLNVRDSNNYSSSTIRNPVIMNGETFNEDDDDLIDLYDELYDSNLDDYIEY
jgi:hypothetical protein